MAEQQDTWNLWYEWQSAPDVARDIRHTGNFKSHAFDRDLYSKQVANVAADIAAAYLHTNDPADRAMVTDVIAALAHQSNICTILFYAIYECRELIAGGALSKEQVFDLWLERAAEMTL